MGEFNLVRLIERYQWKLAAAAIVLLGVSGESISPAFRLKHQIVEKRPRAVKHVLTPPDKDAVRECLIDLSIELEMR